MVTLFQALVSCGCSAAVNGMLLRYVLPYIFLPSQLMGKPGRLDPLRDQFKKRYPGNFKESCVPSGNHTLDAFEWINPAGTGAGLDQQRWIVWLNAVSRLGCTCDGS